MEQIVEEVIEGVGESAVGAGIQLGMDEILARVMQFMPHDEEEDTKIVEWLPEGEYDTTGLVDGVDYIDRDMMYMGGEEEEEEPYDGPAAVYNLDFECTYMEKETEEEQDDAFQMDYLAVFSYMPGGIIDDDFMERISKCIEELYAAHKDNAELIEIIKLVRARLSKLGGLGSILMQSGDDIMFLMYLFSFDCLHVAHPYFASLLRGSVDEGHKERFNALRALLGGGAGAFAAG